MSKKLLCLLALAVLALLPLSAASAQTAFLFPIDGSQQVPPVVTSATGIGLIVLNAAQTQITVNIYHSVGGITAAHIHSGAPGVVGGIEITLSAASGQITGTHSVTAAQVASLLSGSLYVNLHSSANPAGEIRGQIVNAFPPQVFISEFCSDPYVAGAPLDTNLDGVFATSSSQSDDEFVEIVNGTDQVVDISGWTVADSVVVRHTFGQGTLLPPGGAITVFGGGDVTNFNNLGMTGVIAGSGFLGLNNGGDTITLADSGGTVIDTHSYTGAGNGESEARFPASPLSTFVLHTSTGTGVFHSAGSMSDGVLIPWPPSFLPQAIYPGTQEDFIQATGINSTTSGGPGNDVKTATAGDTLTILIESPTQTFAGRPFLILGEVFTTGLPPAPVLPVLHVSLTGFFIIVDGATPVPPGLQPQLQPFGNTYGFTLPSGLAGSSILIESLVLDPTAANGIFATSDGHEIQMF